MAHAILYIREPEFQLYTASQFFISLPLCASLYPFEDFILGWIQACTDKRSDIGTQIFGSQNYKLVARTQSKSA